jgi:hypothetical protein
MMRLAVIGMALVIPRAAVRFPEDGATDRMIGAPMSFARDIDQPMNIRHVIWAR